jgi:hypothetical protein
MEKKIYFSGKCDKKYKRKMKYAYLAISIPIWSALIIASILSYPLKFIDVSLIILLFLSMHIVISIITTEELVRHMIIYEGGFIEIQHRTPLFDCLKIKPHFFSHYRKWNEFIYYIYTHIDIILVPKNKKIGSYIIGPDIYRIDNDKVTFNEKVTVKDIIKFLKRKKIKELKLEIIERDEKIRSMLEDKHVQVSINK